MSNLQQIRKLLALCLVISGAVVAAPSGWDPCALAPKVAIVKI